MHISKAFSTAAVIISLTATSAFVTSATSASNGLVQNRVAEQNIKKDCKQKHDEFAKDPIKALENKKARIQTLLKDGKITKEKADEKTSRIDAKIKEIQSFNKLTLQQKKDKLINDYRVKVEKRVKEGKLDKANVDTILKNYIEKVNNWDGNGYPQFHAKGLKGKCEKLDTGSK